MNLSKISVLGDLAIQEALEMITAITKERINSLLEMTQMADKIIQERL
jgi:hypothetical protein